MPPATKVLAMLDGARLPLLPSMIASGARVRASCERACRTGLARHLQANGTAGTPGIYRDELLTAVADELDAVAKTLTVGNLAHALTLPAGTTAEQVVALEPPTGTARHRFVGRPLHI